MNWGFYSTFIRLETIERIKMSEEKDVKVVTQEEFKNIVLTLRRYEELFHHFDTALMNVMFASESVSRLLVEKGILTEEEILAKAKEIDEKTAEQLQQRAEEIALKAAKEAAEVVQAEEAKE